MSDQEVRDKSGRLIGRFKTLSDGKIEGRAASGTLVGTYNPKSNETKAPNGSLVGKGNLLATLFPSPK